MKIVNFYPDRESLKNMDETYKGAFDILNILYMEDPQGGIYLESRDFIDYFVMSCVRTISEKLTEEVYSFPTVFKICKQKTFQNACSDKMDFDDFRVNADYEHATIFGAVYYVLTIQGNINQRYLDFIEKTFTKNNRLQRYFIPFKEAAVKVMEEEKFSSQKGKKNEVKKLTPAQAYLFCEALLSIRNCQYTNKKETIAPLASGMFGWAISTMERNMSYTKEDRRYVAKLFEESDPEFSKLIENFGNKSKEQILLSDSKPKSD